VEEGVEQELHLLIQEAEEDLEDLGLHFLVEQKYLQVVQFL
jgi:hypothetical protein